LFEDKVEVNIVEDTTKETASEWLVDSGASVHATSCKEDLNDPEIITNQAVTIGSGKVIAAQFKGKRATILTDMEGGILKFEDTLSFTNFKKKIVSLSKLLDQGYKVKEWTKTHLKISCNNKTITITQKPDHQMLYLIGFNVKPEVYATKAVMDINKAHEKLGYVGETFYTKQCISTMTT